MGSNVSIARHALAIDEQRVDFAPTLWVSRKGVDLKQVWFSGVHTDVGGSYPPDIKTNNLASDIPLAWMISEAKSSGLKFEPHIIKNLSDGTLAPLHKSRRHIFRLKRRLHRPLLDPRFPSMIHNSVKSRYLHDDNYRPQKLTEIVKNGWDGIDVD